jgi:hypothetical protein
MENNQSAALIDPDKSLADGTSNLNLPQGFGIAFRTSVCNSLRKGSEAINGNLNRRTSERDEIVTKFGLHCGDSVMGCLKKVNPFCLDD